MLQAWNIPAFWNTCMTNVTKLNYHFTHRLLHYSEERAKGGRLSDTYVPSFETFILDLQMTVCEH